MIENEKIILEHVKAILTNEQICSNMITANYKALLDRLEDAAKEGGLSATDVIAYMRIALLGENIERLQEV